MIKVIMVAIIFVILIVVLVSFPNNQSFNRLKIILSVMAVFVSLQLFSMDMNFEIVQKRNADLIFNINKKFLERGKPILTEEEQKNILSAYLSQEQSYLRKYIKISFIGKGMITTIFNKEGDNKCHFFIHEMNESFGDKYQILVNNKSIKEMTHSEKETEDFCSANQKIVVQAFLPQ